MYRKELSNTKFDTLEEFSKDFLTYVRNITSLYQCEQHTQRQIGFFVNSFYNEIFKSSSERLKNENKEQTDEKIVLTMVAVMNSIKESYVPLKVCSDCQNLTLDSFTILCDDYVTKKLEPCIKINGCPVNFKEIFIETLFYILRSTSHVYAPSTGLVIFGYGEKDLMPAYYSYKVSDLFEKRLKNEKVDNYIVDGDNGACLTPFAQTDVANTVVRGIDDALRSQFYSTNEKSLSLLVNTIVTKLSEVNAPTELINVLKSLDVQSMSMAFKKDMDDFIWDNYVSKLIDIVEFLGKEDLADMAESLVKMTGLNRHVTTDEESVGGPVDVAVVTKCDGFIWIKRKHYFSPELNPNYFQRTKLY